MAEGMTSRDAAAWYLALKNSPDDNALRARFEDWLAETPAHRKDWDDIVRTYRVMGLAEPALRHKWGAFAAERIAARPTGPRPVARSLHHTSRSAGRPAGHPRRVVRTLVVGAVAACLAVVFVPKIVLRLQADHLTSAAEMRDVPLDDGSMVYLAPQSAIAVTFTDKSRQIDLLTGEAFFEVTPDTSRPFHVMADDVETIVLGTAFNVRRRGDGVEVGVQRGHVRVVHEGVRAPLSEALGAGDRVQVASNGETALSTAPPEDMAAWRRGKIIARGQPVSDVVAEIRPYFEGYILLLGDDFAQRTLTGVYDLRDPIEAVRAVASAENATVRQISPWVLVISGD